MSRRAAGGSGSTSTSVGDIASRRIAPQTHLARHTSLQRRQLAVGRRHLRAFEPRECHLALRASVDGVLRKGAPKLDHLRIRAAERVCRRRTRALQQILNARKRDAGRERVAAGLLDARACQQQANVRRVLVERRAEHRQRGLSVLRRTEQQRRQRPHRRCTETRRNGRLDHVVRARHLPRRGQQHSEVVAQRSALHHVRAAVCAHDVQGLLQRGNGLRNQCSTLRVRRRLSCAAPQAAAAHVQHAHRRGAAR